MNRDPSSPNRNDRAGEDQDECLLRLLFEAIEEGREASRRELNDRMRADEAVRFRVVELLVEDTLLEEELREGTIESLVSRELPDLPLAGRGRRSGSRRSFLVATAIAACLALAAGVLLVQPDSNEGGFALSGWLFGSGENEPMDQGVAVVSRSVDVAWEGDVHFATGDTVAPGEVLRFASGFVQLEFYQGAQLTLGGPAELELIDANSAICRRGKARAQVPAVARGFTLVTPDSEVVDLGTEFGVEVGKAGKTEVHVFDGEVELFHAGSESREDSGHLLTTGLAMRSGEDWLSIPMAAQRFAELDRLDEVEADTMREQLAVWEELSYEVRDRTDLVAYYPLERGGTKKRRTVPNVARHGEALEGAIVGARWTDGPFPGKSALEFKKPGDCVRVEIPGSFTSLTLAAWVRVDGLDRGHQSLLLTDGWDVGDVHWQFRRGGELILGVRHADKFGHNYESSSIVDLHRLGRWMHLATVVDGEAAELRHYLDGRLLTTERLRELGPFQIGSASLGNWRAEGNRSNPIRTLNGRLAEVMVFSSALEESMLRRLALQPET